MKHDTLPENPNLSIEYSASQLKDIYLAGGCFWGVEAYMARVPGVAETTVGYANGRTENPTYEEVCRSNTGHAETVHVRYDPARISLADLLRQFFQIIDPTVRNRQGNDFGTQYRTGIYYVDAADEAVIRAVVAEEQQKLSKRIVTEVEPLQRYDKAEEYHQKYLEKNPHGYCHITFDTLPAAVPEPAAGTGPAAGTSPAGGTGQADATGSTEAAGPDARAQKSRAIDPTEYPKPSDKELRAELPRESYAVTQGDATEPPFTGRYWDSDEEGLYVDIVTGEPLFTSMDKFHSSCGWPSFSKPVDKQVIKEKMDRGFGMMRTEVRSRAGDSHLGHVFTDGPRDRGGLRYCINSAALRFIPKDQLEAEGYGAFRALFDEPAGEGGQPEQDKPDEPAEK